MLSGSTVLAYTGIVHALGRSLHVHVHYGDHGAEHCVYQGLAGYFVKCGAVYI
jgi:hypothetical protein